MNPNDKHYTPTWLSDRVAALLPSSVQTVVDLAAGAGALLDAVERKQGSGVRMTAVDLDRATIQKVAERRPEWITSHANSLNSASYRASRAYRACPGHYDAAVLNPPFSYRGGARTELEYGGKKYRVSPATAFVASALNWVRPDGMIAAILPENVMNIRGDVELWQSWKSQFSVDTVERLDRYTFPTARTTTLVVRLELGLSSVVDLAEQRPRNHATEGSSVSWSCGCLDVIRGRVPVHRAREGAVVRGAPFIHSTDLRNGTVLTPKSLMPDALASSGPFVLLPRVGAPTPSKVVIAEVGRGVLSDCVFALRPRDPNALKAVREVVRHNFSDLAREFSGSCAPYLTVDRLMNWLASYGLSPRRVAASEMAPPCACSSQLQALA